MAVRYLWTIICRKSIEDSKTRTISIFEILEQVTIQVPKDLLERIKTSTGEKFGIPLEYEIVSMWERDDINAKQNVATIIEIVDPTGEVIQKVEQPLPFADGKRNVRLTGKVQGFPVTKSGIYRYRIRLKEGDSVSEPKGDIPLEIVLSPI
jgi:hypothetical protein